MLKAPFRAALAAILVAAIFCAPLDASAKKTKCLVLELQSDDLDDADRAAATTVIRAAVAKYPKLELLETPKFDFFEAMMDLECTDIDAGCLGKIGKKYGGQRLIYTEAAAKDTGFKVVIRVVNVTRAKVSKEASATAEGKDKIAEVLGGLLINVLGPAPKPKPKSVPVKLTANVNGAEVFVNGQPVGLTPVRLKLKAGRYRVRVVKKGFVDLTQELRVGRQKLVMKFTLKKKPIVVVKTKPVDTKPEPIPSVDDGPFYTQWWFWAAVGVGVAGITTTVVLLTMDDEPLKHGMVDFGVSAPDYDPLVLGAQ